MATPNKSNETLIFQDARVFLPKWDYERSKNTAMITANFGYVFSKVCLAYVTILIVFGVIGNMLTLVLLKRNIFSPGVSVLFRFLVLMDSNILLTVVSRMWLNIFYDSRERPASNVLCKLHFYYAQMCQIAVNWNIIAIAIVRYIYLKYPLKASRLCSEFRTVCLVFLNIFLSSTSIIAAGLTLDSEGNRVHDLHIFENTGPLECLQRPAQFDSLYSLAFPVIRILLLCVIPAVFLLGANTGILIEYTKVKDKERMLQLMATSSVAENIFKKQVSKQEERLSRLTSKSGDSRMSRAKSLSDTPVDSAMMHLTSKQSMPSSEILKILKAPNIDTPSTTGNSILDLTLSRENAYSQNAEKPELDCTPKISNEPTSSDSYSTATSVTVSKGFSRKLRENASSHSGSNTSTCATAVTYQEAVDMYIKKKLHYPRRFQLFYIIMVSNISFPVFHVPYIVWYFGLTLWKVDHKTDEFVYLISLMLMYTSYAVNFLIYGYSGSRFREELQKILRCKWRCQRRRPTAKP